MGEKNQNNQNKSQIFIKSMKNNEIC